jgi:hypothetical protein
MRPMNREPKRRPFINRAFEQGGGLTYLFFPKCRPKGIAQMANHLMGGHVSPTGFTLRAHPLQSVDHLFSVRYIEECFHFGKGILHIQNSERRRSFLSRPRPKSRWSRINRKGSSQYPALPAWQVYRKKALFKRGVRCSEAFRHLLAEGRILTEFLN